MKQDIVVQLPTEVASYKKTYGKLPDDLKLEPGSICKYGDKYFVHARATLPLKAIEDGVGFGLWVEVDKDSFVKYYKALDNDNLYKVFKAKGRFKDLWPSLVDCRISTWAHISCRF